MESIMTYRVNQPSTGCQNSLTITTIYIGNDKEIAEMEAWCKKNIGYELHTKGLECASLD